MRYTEARLAAIAEEMLVDIDKDTVDFVPNFDDSLKEPSVLPARLPNLLVNGTSGIAVGMATNIPPHNLGEVCDAIAYLIDNPEADVDDLMQVRQGPDFPTGGIILGTEGIQLRLRHRPRPDRGAGQGHSSRTPPAASGKSSSPSCPTRSTRPPWSRASPSWSRTSKVDGISDLRDESDRQGMRIVIELKREAEPQQVLNNLYKHTPMQSTFFVNMLALVDGQPRVLSLKEALQYFIDFRQRGHHPPHQVRAAAAPRSGPTSWKASRSPSTTWTRSSRPSANRRTPKPPAPP